MTIEETRQIIISYFEVNHEFLEHRKDCCLRGHDRHYQIRPDDAFYYSDKVLLFEYENTKRPVESISKYFWLLKATNWLIEAKKIELLITINNQKINQIRTESVQILGEELNKQYPNDFVFHFLNYGELTEQNLLAKLEEMTVVKD